MFRDWLSSGGEVGAQQRILYTVSGILALLVYLGIAWFVLPAQAVWSPDTGAKLLQLQNLRLEDERLVYDIRYPGRRFDPELQFAHSDQRRGLLTMRAGKLYFQRLPIFPLLSLPLFRWLGFRGLYLLPALGGAASGVLALALLRPRDRRFAMWMLIAFGSPVYIYATLFWEHTLAVALGLAAAWLAFRISSITQKSPLRKMSGWIAVGLVLGISAYVRLELVIFASASLFAHWVIGQDGRWGPALAGVMFGLAMLPYRPLHGLMFAGQEMPDNAVYLFYPFAYLADAGWRAVPDLLIGPFTDGAIDTGRLGILWTIAAVAAILAGNLDDTESPTLRIMYLTGLAINVVIGTVFLFDTTFYRSAHGLLFTTPWAILGLSRAREVWRRGDWRARVIVLSTILGLVGYTVGITVFRASSPHGGLEWGARFAMVFYPLLALIAAWDLGPKRRDVATIAIVSALMLLGLGFQARGIWTIRHDKRVNADLNRLLAEMPERYIVSDLQWIPPNVAPIYNQKQIFVTDTPEELEAWIDLAVKQDVRRFVLLTLNSALLNNVDQMASGYRLEVTDIRRVGPFQIFQVAIMLGENSELQ